MILLCLLLAMASIGFAIWGQARKNQRIAQTYHELRSMLTACSRYYREYGVWPVEGEPVVGRDVVVGMDGINRSVFFRLAAREGEGNEGNRYNARQIDYLIPLPDDPRPTTLTFNRQGDALDPWGNPYRLSFDANFDGTLEIRGDYATRIPGEGVAIWSAGPDQRYGTRHDIRSWR
ncbi:MAG: hypothetical protein H7A43_11175 [Verrucomicrobia bacterium]|nr:hypothetical protein [Verrucomicrobiota bacterium]